MHRMGNALRRKSMSKEEEHVSKEAKDPVPMFWPPLKQNPVPMQRSLVEVLCEIEVIVVPTRVAGGCMHLE
jgi:hypothetical protein